MAAGRAIRKKNKSVRITERFARALFGACVVLCIARPGFHAYAQEYPDRLLTMVVPYPPGAAADVVPRLLMDDMQSMLGQAVVVDNRPGASGTIGTALVARSDPDGYRLVMAADTTLTVAPYLEDPIPFDSRTSFAPIILTFSTPLYLVVNSSLPVKSVSELIEYAKKNPGKLNYGSAGVGTGNHLIGEWLKQQAGIEMTHVPYRGTTPAIQDLMVGAVQVAFGTLPAIAPGVDLGKVRILAIATSSRSPNEPDIPTISETVPAVAHDSWYGLLAPAGTPREIVDRLNDVTSKALKNPSTIKKMKDQDMIVIGGSPADLQRRIDNDVAVWGKLLPSFGLVTR